jgi:murein DD-endopeptidase MepM/ murein hydrolase activator NlpD
MQYQSTSSPIRTISRSVTRRRARRALYGAIGVAFTLGCASALTPLENLAPPAMVAATNTPQPATENSTQAHVVAASIDPASQQVTAINDVISQPVLLRSMPPISANPTTAQQELLPAEIEIQVGRGDTLISLLSESGVSREQAELVQRAVSEVFDVRDLRSGQRLGVALESGSNPDGLEITSLSMPISPTTTIEVSRLADAQFKAKKIEKPLERKLAFAGGKIKSSLYQTASDIGLPRGMVGEIINALSYDVDFQRDIKSGDTIQVLYERMENYEGKHAGTGDLIFAELTMGGESLRIYRYEDKTGFADFYNEAGESVRKALLRTPISGARISSGYGMRSHPILGYNRMHRGVDFAAPIGTPIYAAGDGKVEFVGRKGGYGNFLKIAHNNKYSTAYAHLSRFANGIAPGRRVRQGQIVAYVGNTGSSTGPHLHYEVHVNGEQVNPSGVRFKTGNVLRGTELAAFKRSMEKIEAKVEAVKKGNNDIAMADFKREVYSN